MHIHEVVASVWQKVKNRDHVGWLIGKDASIQSDNLPISKVWNKGHALHNGLHVLYCHLGQCGSSLLHVSADYGSILLFLLHLDNMGGCWMHLDPCNVKLHWIAISLQDCCCMKLLHNSDGHKFGGRSGSSNFAPRLTSMRLDFWMWIVHFVMMVWLIIGVMGHIQLLFGKSKTSFSSRWRTCVVNTLALGSLLIASANLARSLERVAAWRRSLSRRGPVPDAWPWRNA